MPESRPSRAEAFEIRAAVPEDAEAIARTNVAAGRAAWDTFLPSERLTAFEPPTDRWLERLADAGAGNAWVAVADGEVVGFAVARPSPTPDEPGEVTGLYTLPSVWGLGAGRALLGRALEALAAHGCHEAVLWTEERNTRPRAFYEAAGWRPDGARREREFLDCPIRELRYRIALPARARG